MARRIAVKYDAQRTTPRAGGKYQPLRSAGTFLADLSGVAEQRLTREVLDDHLRLAALGDLEADLARNFAPDIVLLTSYGIYRGIEGVRQKARLLDEQLPQGDWTYQNVMAEGELGFLEWAGEGKNGSKVEDGADSYVIRDGRIVAMSIHYTVKRA